MKKRLTRVLSLLMAGAMIMGTLTACGNNNGATDNGTTQEQTATDSKETPLVVGYLQFSEKFSPFFAESGYDVDAKDMTQVQLITQDRTGAIVYNAIDGETIAYNGTDYTYQGIADVTVDFNEETDKTTYNFKLRDDITFSDGQPLTADDVIFSLYVLADSNYDGSSTLYSQPIVGLKNYRANSTAAETVTVEDVNAVIAEMPEVLETAIIENVITPTLTSEVTWCQDSWEQYADAYGVSNAEEFFVVAYSLDENYSADGKDMDTILADMIAMYGADYKSLGAGYAGDESHYDSDVYALAETVVIERLTEAGEGEEVPSIEGIKKLGDYEVEITTNGFDATTIYSLGIDVAPLHYYGDKALYDYDNNSFGFTRGDLSIVRSKTTTPMGAGAYKFVKYDNKIVYFEANPNFYKGAPKTTYVQFKESTEKDKVAGVEQGTIDITDPSGSKAIFEQIASINGNDSTSGEKIVTNAVDNLGYGYIGINAETVNVAGEPSSEASKNLRKALATVLSVYRDISIDSYYGDAASIINYPISNTSWAAPQKSDADYKVAYSVDVEGNNIFTDGMSADDKYAAALEASLGFFEAAGYTVADGKLTAAPEGAKMNYEIIIPADGAGDHPSFAILADAKAAFDKIGFTLEINDPSDSNVLWDSLNAKTQEMWTAAWQATVDPDMYQTYHSEAVNSNHYQIKDAELDANIMDARSSDDQSFRKAVYKDCLDIIMDWAVEIPVYQRQNCVIYSPERVNADTFTKDVTTFYKWTKEIENVEMK